MKYLSNYIFIDSYMLYFYTISIPIYNQMSELFLMMMTY